MFYDVMKREVSAFFGMVNGRDLRRRTSANWSCRSVL